MNHEREISPDAQLLVAATQMRGYRGLALVFDPWSGIAEIFRSHDTGCDRLASRPMNYWKLRVVELPGLVVDINATTEQLFAAAEAEVRQTVARQIN